MVLYFIKLNQNLQRRYKLLHSMGRVMHSLE